MGLIISIFEVIGTIIVELPGIVFNVVKMIPMVFDVLMTIIRFIPKLIKLIPKILNVIAWLLMELPEIIETTIEEIINFIDEVTRNLFAVAITFPVVMFAVHYFIVEIVGFTALGPIQVIVDLIMASFLTYQLVIMNRKMEQKTKGSGLLTLLHKYIFQIIRLLLSNKIIREILNFKAEVDVAFPRRRTPKENREARAEARKAKRVYTGFPTKIIDIDLFDKNLKMLEIMRLVVLWFFQNTIRIVLLGAIGVFLGKIVARKMWGYATFYQENNLFA